MQNDYGKQGRRRITKYETLMKAQECLQNIIAEAEAIRCDDEDIKDASIGDILDYVGVGVQRLRTLICQLCDLLQVKGNING